MLDLVTIRVADRAASRRFYEAVLGPLALGRAHVGDEYDEWQCLALAQATPDRPITRSLHVAFAAASCELVDRFWRAGVDAGHRSDGEPGLRPQYAEDYYGAFLLDPDGNSVEAVHRSPRTESGPPVDHLWLGVADLGASRRFWETVAPALDLRVAEASLPGLVSVARGDRHLMLVADGRPPSENLELAFTAAGGAAVAEPAVVLRGPDEWSRAPS